MAHAPRLASVITACMLAPAVHAGTHGQTLTASNIPNGSSTVLAFPKLDAALGSLQSVTLRIQVSASGTIQLENTNAAPVTLLFLSSGWALTAALGATPSSTPACPCGVALHYLPTVTLGAYDGTTDFAGTSGQVITFTNGGSGSTGSAGMGTFTDPAVLASFVGVGTTPILVGDAFIQGPNAPAGVVLSATIVANASVTVTHDYRPGTYCFGDGSALPCPCGNNGASGHGCGNSAFATGARLTVTGTTSVASDTARFDVVDVTGSVAIFFQGGTQTPATIIDDGVGCVGGPIVRLGNRSVATNTTFFPQPGDPRISVRGGVPPAGGTFFYQCFYRNSAATYCPPATSNRTNGLQLTWTP